MSAATDLLRDRRVAPSILAADYTRLGAQVEEVMDAGARVIHIDVMDGHFVPPITIGPLIVKALEEQVHGRGAVLDVHLMIEQPRAQFADFIDAGADGITFHVEATAHAHYALQELRDAGCRAGIAINPGTPAEAVAAVAGDLDLVLCMTVNPGWGGQPFIASSADKIRRLAELVSDDVIIEVDGGVDEETIGQCSEAGATLFVAGSAVFGKPDPGEALRAIAARA